MYVQSYTDSKILKIPVVVTTRSKVGSAVAGLLGLQVRVPLGANISVFCECCLLSGRGPCDGPIPRPEESH